MGKVNGAKLFANCREDAEKFMDSLDCEVCSIRLPKDLKLVFPKRIRIVNLDEEVELDFPTAFRTFRSNYTGGRIVALPFYARYEDLLVNTTICEIGVKLENKWKISIYSANELNVFFGNDVDKRNLSTMLFTEIIKKQDAEENVSQEQKSECSDKETGPSMTISADDIQKDEIFVKKEVPVLDDVSDSSGALEIAPCHRSAIYGATAFNRLETFLRFAYLTCKDIDSTSRGLWPKGIREQTAEAYSIISALNRGLIDCE